MPKNLMPVDAVCGNPLASSQRHGSMLVAQEIRVSQFELEACGVWCHGKDRLSLIGESLAVFRGTALPQTSASGFVTVSHAVRCKLEKVVATQSSRIGLSHRLAVP